MEYQAYDSSGTDDDLPPSHQNRRMSRGGRIAGNGRSGSGSVPYPRMYSGADMEIQIHQLEQEAYISVIRAFRAQADAISWEKEGLITELRKELRLSNEENSEILARLNGDETIRRIREWRQAGGLPPGLLSTGQAVHDPLPSPTVSASRKKQKLGQSVASQSFSGPSPGFHPQTVSVSHQPPSSSAKQGAIMGPKGKKQKQPPVIPITSSKAIAYPSSGPSGRAQVSNRVSSGALPDGATFDSLIGRRVRTRWPDDNNFYEAVITDYKSSEGRHALVYDMHTPKETWEWVNLSEISSEDLQWVGEDPGISRQGYSVPGHGMSRGIGRDGVLGSGRGRGVPKGHSRKHLLSSQNGVVRKRAPDDIRILHTDTLIIEVERVLGARPPDPLEVEKVKRVLKDHEQSLIDAISRLTDLSDGESDEGGRQFLRGHSID